MYNFCCCLLEPGVESHFGVFSASSDRTHWGQNETCVEKLLIWDADWALQMLDYLHQMFLWRNCWYETRTEPLKCLTICIKCFCGEIVDMRRELSLSKSGLRQAQSSSCNDMTSTKLPRIKMTGSFSRFPNHACLLTLECERDFVATVGELPAAENPWPKWNAGWQKQLTVAIIGSRKIDRTLTKAASQIEAVYIQKVICENMLIFNKFKGLFPKTHPQKLPSAAILSQQITFLT